MSALPSNIPVAMSRIFLACAMCSVFVPAFYQVEAAASQNEEVLGPPVSKGHLRPFGESGPKFQIEESTEFPAPLDFFVNYVSRSKPIKFSGVARNSRAFKLWTDDYLLALDFPADSVVHVETKKKENREQDIDKMHFHNFLRIYNQTEYYMVDDVPDYLRPDIMVPCSLQCTELMEKGLAIAQMWFSSGGTKSVIHTDTFDNINCLIRGEKSFVLVDPARNRKKIFLHTNGSYSDIDVDSVDLTKYPSVAEMEFYHVNLTAGYCLYIPYLWIHQVRSYNSNLAVNFWWDHYITLSLLQTDSVCQGQCSHSLTLDQMSFGGIEAGDLINRYEIVRDQIGELVLNNPATEKNLADMLEEDFPSNGEESARKFFGSLDLNNDGIFTVDEHAEIPVQTWKEIQEHFSHLVLLERENKEAQEMENIREEL